MPDKSLRRLRTALRIAVWAAGLRHSLVIIRLGWANGCILRWFADDELKTPWHIGLWLPIRRSAHLFGSTALPLLLEAREARRLRRLRGRLNKVYARHQPAIDPLTSPRARRLQAVVMRNAFRELFRIRLHPADAVALAGYGSAGMAAQDFLNYAGDFGWSIEPALTLQLFLSQADIRHAKVSSRRGILRTLQSLARLHRRAGIFQCLFAARYGAERLLSAVYWAIKDRRENRIRCAAACAAHKRESAANAEPLRSVALWKQQSLLAVFVNEMQWSAMNDLLELRVQMPVNSGTTRRFEIALAALENNTQSVFPDQLREENKNAR